LPKCDMTRLTPRPLPKGIYTPIPTFFKLNEDLDLEAYKTHVRYVAAAGTVPVIAGSAGEAPHLTSQERSLLIKTARSVLDDGEGTLSSVPIVTGVGAPSTRETIQLAHDAKAAGADYVMVLPSGYYAGQLSNRTALTKYFVDVAEASPLPIVLYNFPAVSGGIDLDSDLIVNVIKACPNVVGVKLTCASVGKITRLNAVISTAEFQQKYPRQGQQTEFRIIDGFIDILLPSIASGSAGAISGLPNIAPRTCVRLWELSGSLPGSDDFKEAQRLQAILALADGACQKIGVSGEARSALRFFILIFL
ncbi:unnamed protein product, partial [Clonostachys chloroleuca]